MSTFAIVTNIVQSYQYNTPFTMPKLSWDQFEEVFSVLKEVDNEL